MKAISEGATVGNKQKEVKDRKEVIRNITNYIVKEAKTLGHMKYAFGFWGCLILNLVNAVFNFELLDIFIEGQFRNLGSKWIAAISDTSDANADDRLLKEIFPRMTNCLWKQHGRAGHYESKNYMCILATNIVIEKVFVFLWFWLIFLIINSACVVIYYGLLLFSNNNMIRQYFLAFAVKTPRKRLRRDVDKGTIKKESTEGKKVNKYLSKLAPTNFFFLYVLANNIDFNTLQEILKGVAKSSEDIVECVRREKTIIRQKTLRIYPKVDGGSMSNDMEMSDVTPSAPQTPSPEDTMKTSEF